MSTNYFVFVLLLIGCFDVKAQHDEGSKKSEFAIVIQQQDNLEFGGFFRKKISKSYLKIGVSNFSLAYQENIPLISTSFPEYKTRFSGGLSVGLEFRKQLSSQVNFYHGPNLALDYTLVHQRTNNPALASASQERNAQTYTQAIQYALGLLYSIKEDLYLLIEFNPTVGTSTTKHDDLRFSSGSESFVSRNIFFGGDLSYLRLGLGIKF